VKVITWNIHRCIGLDGGYRPERIASVLKSLKADVIALQEVDSSLLVDAKTNQLEYLASKLGMEAVMGPTLRSDYGAYGNAILTRHEILQCEEHDLSFRRFEPRGALAIVLRHECGPVRVVNTHLGLKYWERAFQVDRLLSRLIWDESERVVVAGDFNEWLPWTGNNLRLERSFSAFSKRMATFPSQWPRFALDRVFVSGDVDRIDCKVVIDPLARVASDHLPLIAEIEFKGSRRE